MKSKLRNLINTKHNVEFDNKRILEQLEANKKVLLQLQKDIEMLIGKEKATWNDVILFALDLKDEPESKD